MLSRLREIEQPVYFTFDGVPLRAERGDMLATALLAVGVQQVRRSVVSGAPRGPFCLMGVCFECLITIDGVQNRQACLIEVEDGMTVLSQHGASSLPTRSSVDEGQAS
ncbi:(2Fe-2S)-binding protein [Mesorhizobium sp. M0482]|uniref:(2Fe-2S)-binding protein n=1 Tax=Mesorhizobium sp. M0482 TaxID=2956948 RepID=UPI00333B5130